MANKESISASIVQKAPIAKVVLMPGDPLRAKTLADNYLSDVVLFNDTRNMLGFTGTYEGKTISVMGHGMGVPSIGIYTQELYSQFGVDAIIRIGSAGGLDMDVDPMDVVIAEAASSNSNYGNAYGVPGQLAACADYDMLETAVEAAKKNGVKYKVGKVYSSDLISATFITRAISSSLRVASLLPISSNSVGVSSRYFCISCFSSHLAFIWL